MFPAPPYWDGEGDGLAQKPGTNSNNKRGQPTKGPRYFFDLDPSVLTLAVFSLCVCRCVFVDEFHPKNTELDVAGRGELVY